MFFERFHLTKWLKTTIKNRHQQPSHLKPSQSVANNSDRSSETIIASVVEEMLYGFENSISQTTTVSDTATAAAALTPSTTLSEQEEEDYLGCFGFYSLN